MGGMLRVCSEYLSQHSRFGIGIYTTRVIRILPSLGRVEPTARGGATFYCVFSCMAPLQLIPVFLKSVLREVYVDRKFGILWPSPLLAKARLSQWESEVDVNAQRASEVNTYESITSKPPDLPRDSKVRWYFQREGRRQRFESSGRSLSIQIVQGGPLSTDQLEEL